MNGRNLPREWFIAVAARALGDQDGARRAFDAARAQVEPVVREQPDYAAAWSALGLIDAGLGRKEEAVREGRRACEMLPVSGDAWDGPMLIGNLAEIHAWTGDTDLAIEQLTKILHSPGNTTNGGFFYGGLRGDPRWEPLRGDARFEALVASRAPGQIDPVWSSVRQDSGPPVLADAGLTGPDQTATPAAPVIPDKSIAVLPFENLSADKENAFFTDGVQNEILADLAKVADLKVIARSSVIQYKSDAPRNLPEIATQLGVANVLEGSVQRAGNQVRVTAKLIDARTSAERWGEHYDRPLNDVFAIQSEIAQAIAGQLQAKLSPREQAALAERPTANIRAYEQYVRGKEILDRFLDLKDQRAELLQAVDLLQDATRRDPGFVEAYCSLGRVHDLLYYLGLDATPARRALAREAVDQALKLRPDSGEAHLALAEYYMDCDRDYARAEAELASARPALPNSARFYLLSAGLNRRLGHWGDSTREFEKALELDPQSDTARDLLGDAYVLTRRFADAERFFQPTFRTDYDPRFAAVCVAGIEFAATGNTKNWRAAQRELPGYIDPSGNVTVGRIFVALADGDYPAAYAALAASLLPAFQDVDFSFYYPRAWYEAQIARAAGDQARMRTAFAACRNALEARIETQAEDPRTLAVLAQVDAGLGDKEKALQEGRRAVELIPVSKDAYDGPLVLQGLAQVYVWTGDRARAIDALETLVQLPGYLSYGYLRADPMWSPLRGNPRFEAVVASLAPKPGP